MQLRLKVTIWEPTVYFLVVHEGAQSILRSRLNQPCDVLSRCCFARPSFREPNALNQACPSVCHSLGVALKVKQKRSGVLIAFKAIQSVFLTRVHPHWSGVCNTPPSLFRKPNLSSQSFSTFKLTWCLLSLPTVYT